MEKRLCDLDSDERYLIERYSREQAKLRLLNEIRMTLAVCELEGWDKMEFINDLKEMINSIGK